MPRGPWRKPFQARPSSEKTMKKPAIEKMVLDQLLGDEPNEMTLDQKVEHLRALRQNVEVSCQLDHTLFDRFATYQKGLAEARIHQRRLKEMLDKLTMTPWYPATFVQACDTPEGPRALV